MKPLITTVIVDDEKPCIDVLKSDLSQFNNIKVIDTCTTAHKGMQSIINYRPSLVFVDVEMPKITGFELIQSINDTICWPINVVFYSAYDKYILEAMRSAALDFLLKPYHPHELERIIQRVQDNVANLQNNKPVRNNLIIAENRKIAIQTISNLSFVTVCEVLCFEHAGDGWNIVLTNGKQHALKPGISFKDILKISESFVLVNPKQIINIDHLASVENKLLRCEFLPPFDKFPLEIFVSRRNFPKLKNTFYNL